MESTQNIYMTIPAKEQVMTWSARMPAYCFTELCSDPTLRRPRRLTKNSNKNLKMHSNKNDVFL